MKSGQNNTNKLPKVLGFLGIGKENGINQADLCEMLGCDPNELKAEVQRFRRENTSQYLFICSDSHGYYIARDDSEIREFVSLLTKQATARLETIREAKRMLEEMEGQVSINEIGA